MAEPSPSATNKTRRPIENRDALNVALRESLEGAQREILIMSYELDPALYDQAACSDLLMGLVKRNHRSRIRILISDLNGLRLKGHHLLALSQRTPSFIEIRLQSPRYRSERREWLICDTRSVLYREEAGRGKGVFSPNERHWALELRNQFEEMWPVAEQHPDLRRLSL